jgi:hypothetical protein
VSYNSCDLSLLTRESFIDLLSLPFTMSLHKAGSANCSLQAIKSDSLASLNKQSTAHPAAVGSVVLGQEGKEGLGSTLHPVAELGAAELQAGNMRETLRLAKGGGDHYCIGCGRYTMHLAMLKNLLVSPNVFRPKLMLHKDLLYVHMAAGDMLAAEGAKAVCLQAKGEIKQLLSHEDLADLIPLLEAQDALSAFKRLATQRSLNTSTSDHNSSRTGRSLTKNSSNSQIPKGAETSVSSRVSDEGARLSTSYSRRFRAINSLDGQHVLSDLPSPSKTEDPNNQDASDNALAKRGVSNAFKCIVFVTGSSISHAAVDAAIQLVK